MVVVKEAQKVCEVVIKHALKGKMHPILRELKMVIVDLFEMCIPTLF